jgi:uncharacterized protein with HEPN domain
MQRSIVHKYFGVDLKLVWQVAKNDLSVLKKQIEELLKQHG